jgi:hypothetical protein
MGSRVGFVRSLAVLLPVAVAIGCGAPGNTAVPPSTIASAAAPAVASPTTVSPTFRRLSPSVAPLSPSPSPAVAVATFTLRLPKGWQKIDMTPAAIDSLFKTMSSTNPQLADSLQQSLSAGLAQGIVYWAMDFRNLTFVSNVNVIEKDVPIGMSLDLIEAVNKGQFEQVPGAHLISATHVQRHAGAMVEFAYTLEMKSPASGSFTLDGRQFYFLRDAHVYVLSFSCAPSSATCPSDVESMIDSFAPNL